jgi:hypothetical protein
LGVRDFFKLSWIMVLESPPTVGFLDVGIML